MLIPALRSSAIRPEEEALRVRLEEIEEEVRRGRLRGKLNELWAVVGALGNGAKGIQEGTEWTVVDDEGLAQITQVCHLPAVAFQPANQLPFKDINRTASWSSASHQSSTTRFKRPRCHSREERGGSETECVPQSNWCPNVFFT